jgi:uncharacterized protein YegP (UPF0339 family)
VTSIPRRAVLKTAAAAFGLLTIVPVATSAAVPGTQGAGLRFEMYKDTRGEFRWRLKARNGKVIATGEGYKAKADCRTAIEVIQRGASTASVEEIG